MIRISPRRLGAPALALAAALTFTGPALADDTVAPAAAVAAPTSPEADALGRHIVATAFDHLGEVKPLWTMATAIATAEMKAMAEKHGGVALVAYDRFGPWYGYFLDASAEEFHADRPRYERILGHWLAEKYTAEELQAVADLCDSAAGKEFYARMSASIPGLGGKSGAAPAWSPEAQAAIDRFNKSPGGKAFAARTKAMTAGLTETAGKTFAGAKSGAMSKDDDAKALMAMLEKDPQTTTMLMDVFATWLPGTMRRWGEKAEAAEKARDAALEAGAPPPPASH